MYDNNGDAFGFTYNGKEYYYIKNAQNDVTAIADSAGKVVANYQYDAWGKLLEVTGTNTDIANANPIRYRSYYYDSDTELYYLNTRYYSPDLCRFINADGYVQTGQGVLDKNMFAYCGNNPANRIDNYGNSWSDIKNWFSEKYNKVKTFLGGIFGAGSTVENHTTTSETEHVISPVNLLATVKTGNKNVTIVSKTGDSSKPISVYAKGRSDNMLMSSVGTKFNINNTVLNVSLGLDDVGISVSYTNGNTTSTFGIKADISQLKVGAEFSTSVKWDEQDVYTVLYSNASYTGLFILVAYAYATGQSFEWSQSPSFAPA